MAATPEEIRRMVTLLNDGLSCAEIAEIVGVSPPTVWAVKAHWRMGKYGGTHSPKPSPGTSEAPVTTSRVLRVLASGVHPETGEYLDSDSALQDPFVIRLLYRAADELDGVVYHAPALRGYLVNAAAGAAEHESRVDGTSPPVDHVPHGSPESRRDRNLREGRPARTFFPWTQTEREALTQAFAEGLPIEDIANMLERSPTSITVQLVKAGLLEEDESDQHQNPAVPSLGAEKAKDPGTARSRHGQEADREKTAWTGRISEGPDYAQMRRNTRPLVVDSAPGPADNEMVKRFGADGDVV
jgi:hypothetical protein